jgi:hypothetical protein
MARDLARDELIMSGYRDVLLVDLGHIVPWPERLRGPNGLDRDTRFTLERLVGRTPESLLAIVDRLVLLYRGAPARVPPILLTERSDFHRQHERGEGGLHLLSEVSGLRLSAARAAGVEFVQALIDPTIDEWRVSRDACKAFCLQLQIPPGAI